VSSPVSIDIICNNIYQNRRSRESNFDINVELFRVYELSRNVKNMLLDTDVKTISKSVLNLISRTDNTNWEYRQDIEEFVDFLISNALCSVRLQLICGSDTMSNKTKWQ